MEWSSTSKPRLESRLPDFVGLRRDSSCRIRSSEKIKCWSFSGTIVGTDPQLVLFIFRRLQDIKLYEQNTCDPCSSAAWCHRHLRSSAQLGISLATKYIEQLNSRGVFIVRSLFWFVLFGSRHVLPQCSFLYYSATCEKFPSFSNFWTHETALIFLPQLTFQLTSELLQFDSEFSLAFFKSSLFCVDTLFSLSTTLQRLTVFAEKLLRYLF